MPSERDKACEKLPPWLAFPNVKPTDWPHTKEWNEYRWSEWFPSLAEDYQREYAAKYPEPDGWSGFYEFVLNREI